MEQPLEVLEEYTLRALIENQLFRELKQGWNLEAYPKKTLRAVVSHVLLTVTLFSLCNAYRTEVGDDITNAGIRRHRRRHFHDIHKVIFIAGEHYAIFDLEELMLLQGNPPKHFLRTDPERFRSEYGLEGR